MRQCRTIYDNAVVVPSTIDLVIEWILIGLLVFMPFAFGVVHAWSEEVVIVLSSIMAVCFLLKLTFGRQQTVMMTWAYLPLLLFVFFVIIQLTPLPAWLINIISSHTAALKTELLGDLPNAESVLKSMTLTFYTRATKHDLRLMLSVGAIFVVVLNVFHTPEQIKRLLMAIALIGGVIAAITLGQNIFGNHKIYWFISNSHTSGYSGPFVNHSNYGQFMNLSIGAALGLLMVKLHEAFVGRSLTPPNVFDYLSSRSARSLWLLIVVMSLGSATVFLSLTRGGMVSMLVAAAFTTLVFLSRRSCRGHGWIIVVMALVAFCCILYIGFDAVYDRLASLRAFDEAEAGRLQILKDITVAWTQFPLFGTGLGTHSVVYPMFDRSTIAALAVYAENEYAQVMEETGLIGLGLLTIFGTIIWYNYLKSIRKTGLPISSAAYGLGFGLVAILIHSLGDFGQHLPANATLSAIFCALILVLARQGEHVSKQQMYAKSLINRSSTWCVLLAGMSLIWLWAILGANSARVAEAQWKKALESHARFIERDWKGTDQEYANLISYAAAAFDSEPGNVRYQHWLQVYRWRWIAQTRNPESEDIIIDEDEMPLVTNIIAELNKARVSCPTHGPTYSLLGQIEKFVLNDDSGADQIRKGFRLAPCDPTACFAAGCLDVREGKVTDCIPKFERAVELDGSLFAAVVDIYVGHLSRPHLAILTAGDDISRLTHVARVLEEMQYDDLVEQVRVRIQKLLEAKCAEPDASTWAIVSLANIYRQQGNYDAAIEFYQRALTLNYGQVHWRLELAKLLAEEEKIPEAMRQAKICLELWPEFKAAKKLVADFSVHPATLGEEISPP